jgi:mRNA interferase MazF
VLVVSSDHINQKPLVITVVVGTKGSIIPVDYVRVPANQSGLPMETVFMGFQIRSLDKSRFPANPDGQLPDAYMRLVEEAVDFVRTLTSY